MANKSIVLKKPTQQLQRRQTQQALKPTLQTKTTVPKKPTQQVLKRQTLLKQAIQTIKHWLKLL